MEFTDIELDLDKFEDSTAEDLATFVQAHEENAAAFDELRAERDELATNYETAEETLADIQTQFAELLAEESALFEDSEEVVEAFSPAKTVEKGLATVTADEEADGADEEAGGKFEEDNPPKSEGTGPDEEPDKTDFDEMLEREVTGIRFD